MRISDWSSDVCSSDLQTLGLAAHAGVDLRLIAPVGLPPWPLTRHPRYRALAALPRHEMWKGLATLRPRFLTLPGTGGRRHVAALVRALVPVIDALQIGRAHV